MEELVSIIIPAYNAERWIGDTIRSALSQSWPKKEIIIVDDGSSDNTFAIAKEFESKLVKAVAQQNQGACAARNTGLSLAQGSYIQWLDADDLLAPDKIMNQMKFAEIGLESRVLLTSAFGTFFFCHQRAEVKPNALWQDLSPVDWLLNKFNGNNVWINPAVILVSRKLTEQAGPWNERLVRDNDGEYICRIVAVSEKVHFVREGMSYYRVGNLGSLSNSVSNKARESLALSLSLCTQYLLSLEESERVRAACVRYLQKYLIVFYPERPDIVNQVEQIAAHLGGQLGVPQLSWKYAWIRTFFGWSIAKRAQLFLPKIRWSFARSIDMVLFLIQKRKPTTVWGQQQMRPER